MSDNDKFKDDFAVLDRYQAFSAEILRLALAGIAAIGFLVGLALNRDTADQVTLTPSAKVAVAVALVAFGAAAGGSLAHRYWSSESMACLIRWSRLRGASQPDAKEIAREESDRDRAFKYSRYTIGSGPVALFAGAAALAIALGMILFSLVPFDKSKTAPNPKTILTLQCKPAG